MKLKIQELRGGIRASAFSSPFEDEGHLSGIEFPLIMDAIGSLELGVR